MELCQGFDLVADYAIKFRTLVAQSGWNEAALWVVFRGALNPALQTELACCEEATSLTQFVATAIHLDNLLRQHQAGAVLTYMREAPGPMQLGRSRLSEQENRQRGQMRLCYYCGASGHMIHRCPERPSSAQGLGGGSQNPDIPCIPSIRITAIDSQPIGGVGSLTRQTELLEFQVGLFHCECLAFYVTSSPANPVILGFPWLRRHGPQISWCTGELVRSSEACIKECLLEPVSRPCRTSLVEDSAPVASGHIPRVYEDFREVFSEERAARLP
ncbi:hypothetical protein QTP70_021025, partial [Hemibagrus guttatus]